MGLLGKLKELLGGGDDDAAETHASSPAIDAPYSDHHEPVRRPSMSDADAAGAGFPPEIR
jgi:hypothetical protein